MSQLHSASHHRVARPNVLDISAVTTMNHECRSYIVFRIPEVAPRIVLEVLYVTSTEWYVCSNGAIQLQYGALPPSTTESYSCSTEYYFVVRRKTF